MHSQHQLTMTWNLVLVLLFNSLIPCDSNALPSVFFSYSFILRLFHICIKNANLSNTQSQIGLNI